MPIINISEPTKFEEVVNTPNNVLCLYYWKLCGHCINFAPVWESVTNQYKDRINVVNVESQCVNKLKNKYKIMIFPTIIVYNNGEKIAEFVKERTEKNLHAFIKEHMLKSKRIEKKKPNPAKKNLRK